MSQDQGSPGQKPKSRRQFVKELATVGGGMAVASNSVFYDGLIKSISNERQQVDQDYWSDLTHQKSNQDRFIEAEQIQKPTLAPIGKCGGDMKCDGGCDRTVTGANICIVAKK